VATVKVTNGYFFTLAALTGAKYAISVPHNPESIAHCFWYRFSIGHIYFNKFAFYINKNSHSCLQKSTTVLKCTPSSTYSTKYRVP
jgi:hypothetical protein